jgi:hypothetical protein
MIAHQIDRQIMVDVEERARKTGNAFDVVLDMMAMCANAWVRSEHFDITNEPDIDRIERLFVISEYYEAAAILIKLKCTAKKEALVL